MNETKEKRSHKNDEVGIQMPLPKELHKELRILSVITGKTLRQVIPECLEEGIKTYKQKIHATA